MEEYTQLDFTTMVLDKNLMMPNVVLASVQEHGSRLCQLHRLRNQKRISELLDGAAQ